MGQSAGGMYLVEAAEDVSTLSVSDPEKLAYVTQTTLSVDDANKVVSALKQRFPNILGPRSDDICYATQNRQDAVKVLTRSADVVLVVGSRSSSNSNRLREVAGLLGARSYLVEDAKLIDDAWLDGAKTIGVTAGASAPEVLVQSVVNRLTGGAPETAVQLEGVEEHVVFGLPKDLL